MMNDQKKTTMKEFQLLTIVAEESLAAQLEHEIFELGARGYTVSSAQGKHDDHLRDNPWEGENVRIETITTDEVRHRILRHLEAKYFEKYALIVFYHPVHVVRGYHFQ
ncbi:MAG: P-II family nitrogen regulator [Bacteroidota bacterium]